MARPKRIDLPFSLYHVLSRTNSGDTAFADNIDRTKFLDYLAHYAELFSFRIHAWCLMPNHFHLLIESGGRPFLSEIMRRLLTAYTVYFNRRHRRHGHLFQGRFKSHLVDKTGYLLALSQYIHLNPARQTPSQDPEAYEGSSLFYYLKGSEPEFLHTAETLSFFKGDRAAYGRFVREGLTREIKSAIIQQAYIGDGDFVRRIQRRSKYLQKVGSRAKSALMAIERKMEAWERAEAERLLKQIARQYGCSVEMIQRGRYMRGEVGQARMIAVVLLREHLPWTCGKIMEYLNLQGKSGLSPYNTRVSIRSDLRRVYEKIKSGLSQ